MASAQTEQPAPRETQNPFILDWIAKLVMPKLSIVLRTLVFLDKNDQGEELRQRSKDVFDQCFHEKEYIVQEDVMVGTAGTGEDTLTKANYLIDMKNTHGGFLKLVMQGNEEVKRGNGHVNHTAYVESEDKMAALRHPLWPEVASEWVERTFRPGKWPSQAQIKHVQSLGCVVIPVAHEASKDSETEWKFSFRSAEKYLEESFTHTQRECFLLLEMLRQLELDMPSFLTSEHLKTVLFRISERVPKQKWNDESMGECFLLLLDELMHYLIQGDLPHYFIASNNMIDHVHEDFVWDIAAKVSKIRKNPLAYLDALRRLNIMGCADKTVTKEKFEELLENAKIKVSPKPAQPVVTTVMSHFKMATTAAEENRFNDAIDALLEIRRINQAGGENVASPMMFVRSLESKLPENRLVYFWECLVKRFPEEKELIPLSNMGCYYFAEARHASDEAKQQDLLEKAQECFTCASQMPNATAAGLLDFANFLVETGHYQRAVPHLKTVIETEKVDPGSGNCYGQYEKLNMDENIQQEIDFAGDKGITVSSIVYAQYLLVKCLKEIDPEFTSRQDDADKLFAQFRECCEKEQLKHLPFAYSLLGYTLMRVERYEAAAQAFHEALTRKPDYSLAEENEMTCQALALSIS